MELALDHSALTEIFELPPSDRDTFVAGLRLMARIRITTVNVFEAAAHGNETVRAEKLTFYRELTGALNPLDPPNELLVKTATAHHEGKERIEIGSAEGMLLLHRPELLTPDLFTESFAFDNERRTSFKAMHEELRDIYQAHFAKIPSDRAGSALDLIDYFCERLDTYLDILLIPAYERASGSTIGRDAARTFMQRCAAWRIFWAGRVHALYTRSVQESGHGNRTNAGITDIESSIYLAFTDYFITADRRQRDAFNDLNTLNPRHTKILWYPDLAHGFFGIRPTMNA